VRRRPLSARLRILGWYVALLAASVIASVGLLREILVQRLDDDVSRSLAKEVAELRAFAEARNPETGQPFDGDVAGIFTTYLRRNIPSDGEALLTFVGGRPFAASAGAPHPLDTEPELVQRWAGLTSAESGVVATPAGPAHYLAVPLQREGEKLGVFVVANFVAKERREVDDAIRAAVAISGGVLVAGSALAWVVAGRVLAPIREVTEAARAITESDLTRRIEVSGDDEIAVLASTFNSMLDRLEAAFTTQRAFVDDAGHELRTPITIIRGHLELLGDDPRERAETIELVMDELDRMTRLVEEMLLLAKAERPGFLDVEPVELTALLHDLLARVPALGDRRWEIEGDPAEVHADRQRLTQAMLNLAGNAVRHTRPGDTIAIGSSSRGGEARIWVRDTGSGIAPEEQERIFERFVRASAGRPREDGAGLGLAIVRAIAEAHGGRVELDSGLGEGSTFTIVLPAADHRREPWPES
jgi:two-component system, OmpR family, sensor kinase